MIADLSKAKAWTTKDTKVHEGNLQSGINNQESTINNQKSTINNQQSYNLPYTHLHSLRIRTPVMAWAVSRAWASVA